MSTARFIVGDSLTVLQSMPDASVDLVLTSPPFLALRSYLPPDHPDKALEMGSEPTPGAFIDALLTVTEECRRVLAPHGSLCVELGDTYSGSGGGGGDYLEGGLRYGQAGFDGSGIRERNAAHWRQKNAQPEAWPLDKSLCLIPELYRVALVYGFNPLTGRQTPRWRARNVVRWTRPNPPVGALADKFRPATSDMVVACVGRKRYFDLDAVRTEHVNPHHGTNGPKAARREGGQGHSFTERTVHPAGAPPLDWWAIPTEPYITPDGLLVVPAGGTAHRVRVPVGVPGDGIQRTTSPSCPAHGSPDSPGSSAPDDGREGSESSRNEHNGDRHVPTPLNDSPPTPGIPALVAATTEMPPLGCSPAATPHGTESSRTALAPATSPVGTPSAQRTAHTGGTPTPPELFEQRLDKSESNSAEACPDAAAPGTPRRTAGTSDLSLACSCSYWVELDVATEFSSDYAGWPGDAWSIPTEPFRGSHYATWPSDLLVRPIKAMCPTRVCQTCGVPSERVTEKAPQYAAIGRSWSEESTGRGKAAQRERNCHSAQPPGAHIASADYVTTGWTDCGHGDWRPGVVLDPFAGSGTTLAVATGHGRDAIGIDLDARNADLARQRVGMFLTVDEPTTTEATA